MKNLLNDNQLNAVSRMHNGCILNGEVGSGKSRTALYYFYKQYGGCLEGKCIKMKDPPDLYIITTARKRDTFDWEKEMIIFDMSPDPQFNCYKNKIVVDSWNNIEKYSQIKNAFFIFDEDRVVGHGKWSKMFIKISKSNEWIMLSATPGDKWEDYISVFIANGFYKNKSDFEREHVIFSRYTPYPKYDSYFNEGRLIRLRRRILVSMDDNRHTVPHHIDINVNYDREKYRYVSKNRWNIFTDLPIENAPEYCFTLRRIVNSDPSRVEEIKRIFDKKKRVIIFYNYNFELEILRNIDYGKDVAICEWNGENHQEIPVDKNRWVYLVQYIAGAEGWNCVATDTIIFYSQNYSYKTMHQAEGRINRMNTTYIDLYYYHLKSRSTIDLAIDKALSAKKKFNEGGFYGRN